MPSQDDLVALIAKRFIQNRDVKAIQFSNGDYVPDFRMKDTMPEFGGSPETSRHGLGFKLPQLRAHLNGTQSYGHYILDSNSRARMFAFDIDLEKEGTYVVEPTTAQTPIEADENWWMENVRLVEGVNPRALWLDRNPKTAVPSAREWYKKQMMILAHRFTKATLEIGVPAAVAYSGSKGIHVYGFTGDLPSEEVREAALCVMEMLDDWEPVKGINFYGHKNLDPHTGYKNFSVEVFPKQGSLENKNLGNLMRLPLGRNMKSSDPTFFVDMQSPMAVMRPHPNPVQLLESGDPYA